MLNFARRVLIVGNYTPDNQQSMFRYADLLVSIYCKEHIVVLTHPPFWVGRLPGPRIFQKYLAYIDKLLFFPLWLSIRSRQFDLVHIADHGNAYYAFCCPRFKSIVTCHDLLAVRTAFGDSSTGCVSSPIGIWLQRLIMAGLRRAGAIVFVSQATRSDFHSLIGNPNGQRHIVIPNPLNAPFSSRLDSFRLTPFEEDIIPSMRFLLMVGSSHPRKNRALALQLLEQLGISSPYSLVFAGAPLAEAELHFTRTHPLGHRVISIERPSHALLNHLYCKAHALLFPSFSEGFGWPLLEAQSCNCPIIASSTTSIPEVAGNGALYADPMDVSRFVEHVHTLEDLRVRSLLIQRGSHNMRRFDIFLASNSYRSFAFP